MTQAIIYPTDDGGVAVIIPAECGLTIEQIADKMGQPHEVETLFHILEHMAANKRGIVKSRGRFRYKV